jgi:hypothetical protein
MASANPDEAEGLRALCSAGAHPVEDAAGGLPVLLPVFGDADQATKR